MDTLLELSVADPLIVSVKYASTYLALACWPFISKNKKQRTSANACAFLVPQICTVCVFPWKSSSFFCTSEPFLHEIGDIGVRFEYSNDDVDIILVP